MPSDLPAPSARYGHRPKPFSSPLNLVLSTDSLQATRGARSHEYALADVESLRLVYTPKNTQRLAFTCFLRMRDGRSLRFTNLDWRSLAENARQDEAYSSFVHALVERTARSNPGAALLAGLPAWRHRLFLLGVLVILPALVAAALYLAAGKSWLLVAFASALALWLAFYAREYGMRNRPRVFTAGAIPPEVLPPETTPDDP